MNQWNQTTISDALQHSEVQFQEQKTLHLFLHHLMATFVHQADLVQTLRRRKDKACQELLSQKIQALRQAQTVQVLLTDTQNRNLTELHKEQ